MNRQRSPFEAAPAMSRPQRIPDFFIVGAPKCGTTALYNYLEAHPGIFMSPVKEPHYFYSDFRTGTDPSTRVGGFARPEHYGRLFAKARSDQLCGEGSTLYLFSRSAIPEILRANPKAKLIAMVRNPLDMLVSFHGQKTYNLEEDEGDFAVAWKLSEARSRGYKVPAGCRAPEQLDYRAVGRLGEQTARLLGTAPADQVHVVVFDDLVSDAAAVYRAALQFLGLADPGRTDFSVVNARKEHVLPWLSEFLLQPPFPLNQVKSLLKRRFPAQLKRVGRSIRAINSRPAPRPEVDAELRREMAAEFADDIELLGSLINRDLSHWYKNTLLRQSGRLNKTGR
jgi:Sulfotransferase domain